MSFISAAWGNYGKVVVWEKSKLGNRIIKTYDPVYYFYVPDDKGSFIGIDNVRLKKLTFKNKPEFEMGLRTERIRYESDFSIMERTLMDNYLDKEPPILNVGFIDIEVDYNPEIGFARVTNAYAPISALSFYKVPSGEKFTFVIAPPDWDGKWTEELENVFICENEKELLDAFLQVLPDVDVISGWNSEFFDLPYIAKRIERVLGPSSVKKLNFDGSNRDPQWKEVERFGVKETIIELEGRVHLDYLKLFKKFNLEGRPSFALGAIANDELDIPKLSYEGSLHDLYRNDFTHFVKYNMRDVEILVKLDEKFKYINLANNMVHEATVNFNSVFGSVNLIDTAITNYAHSKLNRIVLDKRHTPGEHVEGAIVMTPKMGLWKWIFSCDINSLYPSVYRSLNLSPEKLVGQFTRNELDWKAIYDRTEETICLRLENTNELLECTGKEWNDILKEKMWAVSAYGTVLDQSNGEGLLPSVLTYWFNGRKELQAKKKEWANKADALLKTGKNKSDAEYIEAQQQADYYDMLQGVRKVLLNSSYGATLNEFCRFHDSRLGASTTATGRQITTFMIETIGSLLSGNNTKVIKTVSTEDMSAQYTYDGNEIIYGDTDSCYACVQNDSLSKEEVVEIADAVVTETNSRFPAFMSDAFMCTSKFNSLIKANREVVAASGIFQAKKKYMLYVVNLEGKDIDKEDKKSFKTMGSDIKMSTTPEKIKQFLKKVTLDILYGVDKSEIESYIIGFRDHFDANDHGINPLDIATQGSAKVLEEYYQKWSRLEKKGLGKVTLPGHIRASINYNECIKMFNDKVSLPITSGSKIKTVYLKKNDHDFKSLAFPADTETFPKWFNQNFQVDMKVMEEKLIDNKLQNIFVALGWIVPTVQSQFNNSVFVF
jgi:DNA polymerase elongation subunit (family B)